MSRLPMALRRALLLLLAAAAAAAAAAGFVPTAALPDLLTFANGSAVRSPAEYVATPQNRAEERTSEGRMGLWERVGERGAS